MLATEQKRRRYTYVYNGSLFKAMIDLECNTDSSNLQVTESSNISNFFLNHNIRFGTFHAVSGLLLLSNNHAIRGKIYDIKVSNSGVNWPIIEYYDCMQDASDTPSLSSGAYPIVSVYGGYTIP